MSLCRQGMRKSGEKRLINTLVVYQTVIYIVPITSLAGPAIDTPLHLTAYPAQSALVSVVRQTSRCQSDSTRPRRGRQRE
jgi:hypothetical protein